MNLVSVLLLGAAPSQAQTADDIVERARAANQVPSSIQHVRMVVVSKKGQERVKELELRSRRDEDKVNTFLEVLSPSLEAGTKMLMIDHDTATDEQMIYLPAYGLNRISGAGRRGAFIGSDFSFEDLDIREAAEGEHTLVSETDEAWVIDTVPADSVQYSKVRSTIGKADHVARTLEFFAKDGDPIKRLDVEKTEKAGEITMATVSTMHNLDRGTHTRLEVTRYQLNVAESELPPETFTPAFLER